MPLVRVEVAPTTEAGKGKIMISPPGEIHDTCEIAWRW
jgi:hypothetical protein